MFMSGTGSGGERLVRESLQLRYLYANEMRMASISRIAMLDRTCYQYSKCVAAQPAKLFMLKVALCP